MQAGNRKRIGIACQGGGSHTSFTAGALKELLVRGHGRYDFVAFSGTSGGGICALLAQRTRTGKRVLQLQHGLNIYAYASTANSL